MSAPVQTLIGTERTIGLFGDRWLKKIARELLQDVHIHRGVSLGIMLIDDHCLPIPPDLLRAFAQCFCGDIAHYEDVILQMKTRKEEHLMFNKILRWILPFLVIALIAVYLVLAPALSTHAAAPQLQQHHAVTSKAIPRRYWRP